MGNTARPGPELRGLVTPYVGFRYAGDGSVHRGLPSTDLTVVLTFDEPLDVGWLADPATRRRQVAMVAGLHTEPAAIHQHGIQHGIQLGFTPTGVRRLLGMPAAALASEIVALSDADAPWLTGLHDRLAGLEDWAARFDVLDQRLVAALREAEPVRPELARAWSRLTGAAAPRVRDVADEIGWSRRHLSALFHAEFGATPKHVARLARFERGRRLVGAGRRLAEVAAEAGYADQAHLTREWRELAGCAPTAWLREELPFVQDEAVTL